MAYTTIDDPSQFFQLALWTGSSGTDTITFGGNSDLQLDFLWSKSRSNAHSNALMDTQRITSGDYLPVFADTTDIEQTTYDSELQSILSDGFTVGTQPHAGGDGKTYVAFAWKANGGTSSASASESGSNVAYNFQVNTTSKFMINKYTGLGSDATLNLGNHFTPAWMLFKNLDQADDWVVYHHKNTSDPDTDHLHLNTNAATADEQEMFDDVNFAADEINIGTNHEVNADGEEYISYAWAEVQGYSKFGVYAGNGNADGPFVYTGFKPAWVMVKKTNDAHSWYIQYGSTGIDSGDQGSNPVKFSLQANSNSGDATENSMDFLSNGFKIRTSGNGHNTDDGTYVYMAFAEHPFVSSKGVPVTAR